MNRLSKPLVLLLAALLLGNMLIVGAKQGIAQGMGAAVTACQTEDGKSACWVAVGNKIYFVEKDDTTILKVKASGAL